MRFPLVLVAFCVVGGLVGWYAAQWVKWPLTILCALILMVFATHTILRVFRR